MLDFDRVFLTRMVQKIVKRWANYSQLGDLSLHDLHRTAITRALESGLNYRQVQMMSKHKDPKTVMRYDHGREHLEQNAINFLRVPRGGLKALLGSVHSAVSHTSDSWTPLPSVPVRRGGPFDRSGGKKNLSTGIGAAYTYKKPSFGRDCEARRMPTMLR